MSLFSFCEKNVDERQPCSADYKNVQMISFICKGGNKGTEIKKSSHIFMHYFLLVGCKGEKLSYSGLT